MLSASWLPAMQALVCCGCTGLHPACSHADPAVRPCQSEHSTSQMLLQIGPFGSIMPGSMSHADGLSCVQLPWPLQKKGQGMVCMVGPKVMSLQLGKGLALTPMSLMPARVHTVSIQGQALMPLPVDLGYTMTSARPAWPSVQALGVCLV